MKNKKKLIATCIEWDTDGEDVDLPNEVCIPDEVIPNNANRTEYMEEYAEEVEVRIDEFEKNGINKKRKKVKFEI